MYKKKDGMYNREENREEDSDSEKDQGGQTAETAQWGDTEGIGEHENNSEVQAEDDQMKNTEENEIDRGLDKWKTKKKGKKKKKSNRTAAPHSCMCAVRGEWTGG